MKIAAVPTTAEGFKFGAGGDSNKLNHKNSFDLADAIKTQYQKMEKENNADFQKKIPADFQNFVMSDTYYEFLESMLDYCKELFRLEGKQQTLEKEAKERGLPLP
jgi:hypothetical protein